MSRAIEHAALQWYAEYLKRMAIGAEKRRVAKEIKAAGGYNRRLRSMECDAAARLTPARHAELHALRKLAKACAMERQHLDGADVIDVDVKQLKNHLEGEMR